MVDSCNRYTLGSEAWQSRHLEHHHKSRSIEHHRPAIVTTAPMARSSHSLRPHELVLDVRRLQRDVAEIPRLHRIARRPRPPATAMPHRHQFTATAIATRPEQGESSVEASSSASLHAEQGSKELFGQHTLSKRTVLKRWSRVAIATQNLRIDFRPIGHK
jgi:hypothetical protein